MRPISGIFARVRALVPLFYACLSSCLCKRLVTHFPIIFLKKHKIELQSSDFFCRALVSCCVSPAKVLKVKIFSRSVEREVLEAPIFSPSLPYLPHSSMESGTNFQQPRGLGEVCCATRVSNRHTSQLEH